MTDKEMTIEEALEVLIKLAQEVSSNMDHNRELFEIWGISCESASDYKQAADVLRQIGKPVVRRAETYDRDMNPVIKRWTETPVLKRVIETSEPTYEPVDTQNEGGRDE